MSIKPVVSAAASTSGAVLRRTNAIASNARQSAAAADAAGLALDAAGAIVLLAQLGYDPHQAAAGIAGFQKLVLALQHRRIPPHLHLERLNPARGQKLRALFERIEWEAPADRSADQGR